MLLNVCSTLSQHPLVQVNRQMLLCLIILQVLTELTRIKLLLFTTRHECCCRSNTSLDVSLSHQQTGIRMAMRFRACQTDYKTGNSIHVATFYLLPLTFPIAPGHTFPPTTLGPGPQCPQCTRHFQSFFTPPPRLGVDVQRPIRVGM